MLATISISFCEGDLSSSVNGYSLPGLDKN